MILSTSGATGILSVDERFKFCREHIIVKTAILAMHPNAKPYWFLCKLSSVSFPKPFDIAASTPRTHGNASAAVELYKAGAEREQTRSDSRDLKEAVKLTADVKFKFGMEHIIVKTVTLAMQPIVIGSSNDDETGPIKL